jgi:hypothetical protein
MAGINDLLLPEERKEGDTPLAAPFDVELQQTIDVQSDSAVDDLVRGFQGTALAGGIRRVGQEGDAADAEFLSQNPDGDLKSLAASELRTNAQWKAAFGGSFDSGKGWDTKEDDLVDLLKGVPRGMASEIADSPTMEAAMRSRARILEDVKRQQVSAAQMDGGGIELVGSMLDVDIVLNVGTGGMIGAAKTAMLARKLSKNKRFVGSVQGVVGGTQAGLLVGAYDIAVRESADNATFISSIIGGAALGGVFGTVGGEMGAAFYKLEQDYARRMDTDDPTLTATDVTAPTEEPTVAFQVADRPKTEVASTAVVTPLDGSPPKRSKAATSNDDVVPEITVRETTIVPDKVEGTATQKKPCTRE